MRYRQIATLIVAMTVVLASGTAQARGGLLFGLDIGGATVSGDQNVFLTSPNSKGYSGYGECRNPSGMAETVCKDTVRTDAGAGFAFGLRFGYNFFGSGALETNVWGHGNMSSGGDKPEGAAYVSIIGRYFPLQHVKKWQYRKWDPSVYVGWQPLAFMGYHTEHSWDNEGRGWYAGNGVQFGLACDYELAPGFSLGLDLRFHKPFYNRFYHSWDDNIKFEADSEPSTLVFAPMLRLTFHFVDPDPDGKIVGAPRRGATNSSRPKSGTGDDYYEW